MKCQVLWFGGDCRSNLILSLLHVTNVSRPCPSRARLSIFPVLQFHCGALTLFFLLLNSSFLYMTWSWCIPYWKSVSDDIGSQVIISEQCRIPGSSTCLIDVIKVGFEPPRNWGKTFWRQEFSIFHTNPRLLGAWRHSTEVCSVPAMSQARPSAVWPDKTHRCQRTERFHSTAGTDNESVNLDSRSSTSMGLPTSAPFLQRER